MVITFDGRGIGYDNLMRAGQAAADHLGTVTRILDTDGVKLATFHPAEDSDTGAAIKQ